MHNSAIYAAHHNILRSESLQTTTSAQKYSFLTERLPFTLDKNFSAAVEYIRKRLRKETTNKGEFMKKLLASILTILSVLSLSLLTACSGEPNADGASDSSPAASAKTLSVYAPDGAPALALSQFISEKSDLGTGANVSYNVVAADTLNGFVGKGDIIVMPVNLATKIYAANSAEKYKMAGVITNGNLYVMAKEDLTANDLIGKVVGVANLNNVPGLTFKAALKSKGVEFVTSDDPVEGKVALKDYTGPQLKAALQAGAVSVGLLPEPVASRLVADAPEFKFAIDLQTLYDETARSYPQAVVLVKSSVLAAYPSLLKNLADGFAAVNDWIKQDVARAAQAISSALAEGVTPSINAKNLTAAVVDNCKINFLPSSMAKDYVNAYITAIRGISDKAINEVGDDFFA